MIDPEQLREYIIRPVLKAMGKYSRNAEELLLLTAAQESALGEYIHQLGGPAKGIYQMEPFTHDDIWDNYLAYRNDFAFQVQNWAVPSNHFENNEETYPETQQLIGNLYYSTAMARCHYLRVSESLPEYSDVEGMARYYKKHYNTHKGKATVEETIRNYNKYVNK